MLITTSLCLSRWPMKFTFLQSLDKISTFTYLIHNFTNVLNDSILNQSVYSNMIFFFFFKCKIKYILNFPTYNGQPALIRRYNFHSDFTSCIEWRPISLRWYEICELLLDALSDRKTKAVNALLISKCVYLGGLRAWASQCEWR